MPVFNVLSESVRGSLAFGHVGDPNPTPLHIVAALPEFVLIEFPSVDWINPGHMMSVVMEISYDGGSTWIGFGGFTGAVSGPAIRGNSWPSMRVSWDGRAIDLRGTVTVDAPFSWGIRVTTA